jgi:hypothetical protein
VYDKAYDKVCKHVLYRNLTFLFAVVLLSIATNGRREKFNKKKAHDPIWRGRGPFLGVVRPGGFEPPTCGSVDRPINSRKCLTQQEDTANGKTDLTAFLNGSIDEMPALTELVESWPDLPEQARTAILHLVRAYTDPDENSV